MAINAFQAALFGLFACLASLPGMGGTTIGNYTLGRPLVAGLIVGIIMAICRRASSSALPSRLSTSLS